MKNLTIILDPPHGKNVEGKRSPDGTHLEYKWGRERINSLVPKLTALGYDVRLTTGSVDEPGLTYRKNVANKLEVTNRKLLLSLHNNASGVTPEWRDAKGVAVYTTKGETESDVCADFLLKQFEQDFDDVKIRRYNTKPLTGDFESNFTVLMGSTYMAVLVEWLFQDNLEDLKLLKDASMNERFENSLVEAVEKINNHYENR